MRGISFLILMTGIRSRANGWFSCNQTIYLEEYVAHHHFCTDRKASECLTTLSLTVFIQRNFVADFLQVKCTFTLKTVV